MSKIDFLMAALPPGTRYSLRLIKKLPNSERDIVRNRLYNSIEAMETDIDEYLAAEWNVYYATAGFGALDNATAENATAKREFYIDVDCGDTKPYATKADGLSALKQFAKSTGLPRPTIIDSGRGIHAHWLLNNPVPVHEWEAVAKALKDKCVELDFKVDGGCTADIVRVLRVPGTINYKDGSDVVLLTPVVYYEYDDLRAIIGAQKQDIFAKARQVTQSQTREGMTEVQKLIASNKSAKFEKIWHLSVEGNGCAQIDYAIVNAGTLSEPMWRGALSIAQFCEDRDWAIHEISKNHPAYDPAQTELKAAKTQGPYTCETFANLEHPQLCSGCKFKGKIKSPIQIGSEVKRSEEAPQIIVKVDAEEVLYDLPKYPFPYFRGANGGVYRESGIDKETGEKQTALIYHCDIYAFKRQRHYEYGDVVWIRCHTPRDGVREFMLPQSDIGATDRLRDGISKEGVTLFDIKQLKSFQEFLGKQIEQLQHQEKAESMNVRFGWTIDNTFIVGDREYTAKGVKRISAADVVQDYVGWFKPQGSIDVWKTVVSAYEPEAFDMHAAGVLAGFGSVLMQISPESGGVLSYYSKASGTGKTTILKLANSIFGDPKALMKDARDTKLSKVHRMGLLNGIVTTIDEMTNIHPDELSDLLYGSTQGRGRDRMHSGTNAERSNKTTWKCISVWSSNASVEDKLGTIKADPQGELARVLEVHLQTPVPTDVLESQKLFNSINTNYGHAAHEFLSWVIPNLDTAKDIWNKVRDKLYTQKNWTQTERYKLNMVVCIVAAGIITNSLGLTNYNIDRIAKRLANTVRHQALEIKAAGTKAIESFAAFINQNINNILVINDKKKNGLDERPYREPKGPLRVRYEPDTKTLYVVCRDFNKWCAESYINAKEMPTLFKTETGTELTKTKKRMGKGWTDLGSVEAYVIADATQVLGIDGLTPEDTANP